MWWFRWHSRRFFRSVMRPMNEERARLWTNRMRFLYIFCGFNAMVLTVKFHLKNKESLADQGLTVRDVTPTHTTARLMQVQDLKIYRSGIGRPTETYTVDVEEYRNRVESERKERRREYLQKERELEASGGDGGGGVGADTEQLSDDHNIAV